MAKYKIGDILLEDRRAYASHRGSGQYAQRDATHPLCILVVEEIQPNFTYKGNLYDHRPCYLFRNDTINTHTFGAIEKIDKSDNFRLAKDTEIIIYGAGREKLEESE